MPSNATADFVAAVSTPDLGAIVRVSRKLTPASAPALAFVPITSTVTQPVDNDVVAPGTVLAWTATPNAIYSVVLAGRSADPKLPTIQLVTSDTKAKVPDLTALGVTLPAGASYALSVQATGPYPSVDVASGAAGTSAFETLTISPSRDVRTP